MDDECQNELHLEHVNFHKDPAWMMNAKMSSL